jgi:tetratricopeptide (TPR) repeat protein
MSASTPPGLLRLERLLDVLPRTDALRPLAARLLASSRVDEGRRWTASGELGTTGGRIVDLPAFRSSAEAWVEESRTRLRRSVDAVARVSEGLATGDGPDVVAALLEHSDALERDGAPADAEAWAEAAFHAALTFGVPRAAEARRRTARCARSQGDVRRAQEAYEEAWTRASDADLWEDAVVAATGRGNVSVDLGRWRDAEIWYERAMDVLADANHGLSELVERGLRWRLCQNLGITHRERGDLDGADAWYTMAEETSQGLEDPSSTVEIGNGRGQLHLARGDMAAAEASFRRALVAIGAEGPDEIRVAVRTNLAEALLLRGRTLEAGIVAREAEEEAIRGRYLGRLPGVYRVLARVVAERGEGEAFVLVERALEIARGAGLPPFQEALTLRTWADLREAQGSGWPDDPDHTRPGGAS